MQDINFDCPFCNQNLDAPSDMAGAAINCPACGKEISIPEAETPVEPTPTEQSVPEEDITPIENDIPEDLKKSTTVKISLPEGCEIPKPKKRIITIKRKK